MELVDMFMLNVHKTQNVHINFNLLKSFVKFCAQEEIEEIDRFDSQQVILLRHLL